MRTAAALLCAGLAAVACTGQDTSPRPTSSGEDTEPSYTLFDVDLDGARPTVSQVGTDQVVTSYERDGRVHFTLLQRPAPAGDLCRALADERMAGDACRVEAGVMTTRMEEMSGVALVRDDTVLYAHSLVTEADAGLLDRAAEALRTARVAALGDLGDAAPADPTAEAAPVEEPAPAPGVRAADFRSRVAVDAVQHLAGTIGPREATGAAYDRAARWVARALSRSGLVVRRQPVEVPAGTSWGVPVAAGRSVNVVATPPGFRAGKPHLVVGAHLDTVPQAPGAEDNASGVGVLLGIAEAVAARRTRLPVVLVAFGAEEPRGPTDADHHYGSRQYVARLTPAQRAALRGMVSLDRVGVGAVVPVGSADAGPDRVADELERAARRIGVPVVREVNRSSDHWQFAQAGLPAARLGSTPYAGYHSPRDTPGVVDPAQLDRVGRLVLAWLAGAR